MSHTARNILSRVWTEDLQAIIRWIDYGGDVPRLSGGVSVLASYGDCIISGSNQTTLAHDTCRLSFARMRQIIVEELSSRERQSRCEVY